MKGRRKPTQHTEAEVNVFDTLSYAEKQVLLAAIADDEDDVEAGSSGTAH